MSGKIKKEDRIKESKTNLQYVINLLDLADNKEITLKDIADKLNITPQELNTALDTRFRYYAKQHLINISEENLYDIIRKLETPSTRILKDVFNINHNKLALFPFYDDEVFWKTLKHYLTEKEYNIICLRYGYNEENKSYTLQEVGNLYKVQRERIRQIESKALRIIRNSKVLNDIFNLDIINMENYLLEQRKYLEDKYQNTYKEFNRMKELLNTMDHMSEIKDFIHNNYPDIYDLIYSEESIEDFNIFDKPIEKLNMSSRLYNCLKRGGYKTLKDIYTTDSRTILRIRNLGKCTTLELIDVVDKYVKHNSIWKVTRQELLDKLSNN